MKLATRFREQNRHVNNIGLPWTYILINAERVVP